MKTAAVRLVDNAARAIADLDEIQAIDIFVDRLDGLFQAGEFEAARHVLAELDPRRFPPKVLTGVLMISSHAREELGDSRSDFFERVKSALVDTWHLSPEAVGSISRRLK